MKRRISLLLAALSAASMIQIAAPAPASACADPNCPWSPITDYVGRVVYAGRQFCDRTGIGDNFDPDICWVP